MNNFGLSEQRIFNSQFDRRVWLAETPADTALIFLDAELYLQRVHAIEVLQQLLSDQKIPPVSAAFVSNHSAASRHADYVCSDAYATFIAKDVVGWLKQQQPALREFLIIGLSLSGLAAAHIASRYQGTFRAAICQSPSFWWEQGRFAAELPVAKTSQQYWICVGSRETDSGVSHPPSGLRQDWTQIAGCDFVCAAMREKGYDLEYRTYDGGHDPVCWREDLQQALPWLWKGNACP
ncbi:alpha/beta hydrolase [Anatilimnocola floriformis]|uniref:alpha/beta hydrolase n=1 Tax=Anatilimnocola floriformis TaxID=2948575 RepID=UPI0020C36581|nr:alpha/beta hydrolase-fold protein [Anatilimnocola floriformis]